MKDTLYESGRSKTHTKLVNSDVSNKADEKNINCDQNTASST